MAMITLLTLGNILKIPAVIFTVDGCITVSMSEPSGVFSCVNIILLLVDMFVLVSKADLRREFLDLKIQIKEKNKTNVKLSSDFF